MLWLLASESRDPAGGKIELSDEDIAFRLRRPISEIQKAIKPLLDKGFVEPLHDDSAALADCEQLAVPETEAETETEGVRDKGGRVTLDTLSVDHIADWLSERRAAGKYLTHDEHFILEYFKNYCRSKGKTYANYIAAYRNAFEWNSCQPKRSNDKPNKDERAKSAVVAGVKAFRDSLAAGH